MKHGTKSLQRTSPADGQTIHGRLRPAIRPVTPERAGNPALTALRLPNQLAAMPDTHQPNASFHAIRLTSGSRSLQSP